MLPQSSNFAKRGGRRKEKEKEEEKEEEAGQD